MPDLSATRIGPLTLRDIVWLVSLVIALAGEAEEGLWT